MYRPYRKHYVTDLKRIAHENWDSLQELEPIVAELSERKVRDDILMLTSEVLEQIKYLKTKQREQAEKEKNERIALTEQEEKKQRELSQERGWFEWPTTFAPIGEGRIDADWPEGGLFSHVGYHVGNNGVPWHIRRRILDCIFHNDDLPRVGPDGYLQEFGNPQTPQRLLKMANVLAAIARNFKRNKSADYSQAIADYEHDLDFLHEEYYVGVFDFAWPKSDSEY